MQIGIMGGSLSRHHCIVDIDHPPLLEVADKKLPPTGMIEGREGKPWSHRYYVVTNVPTNYGPKKGAACHHLGGAGTVHLKEWAPQGQKRMTLVDFVGTGGQVVAPPSLWMKDGRRERRFWHSSDGLPGTAAMVDFLELWAAVEDLCRPFGYLSKADKPEQLSRRAPRTAPDVPEMPRGPRIRDARRYLKKMPPAVQDHGGDAVAFLAACALVQGFNLSVEGAYPIIAEWNRRCRPPWSEEDLWRKLRSAAVYEGYGYGTERGCLIRVTKPKEFKVDLERPGSLFIGEDAVNPHVPYISARSFRHFLESNDAIDPALSALLPEGRRVVLSPPSTIRTNKDLTWVEFFLARHLRALPLTVQSLRLPERDYRKQTVSQFLSDHSVGELSKYLVDVPDDAYVANAEAEAASRRAVEVVAIRKAFPRKKGKLEIAKAFVQANGISTLSLENVLKAKTEGISRGTLQRALAA
jgi:hypothetical protein